MRSSAALAAEFRVRFHRLTWAPMLSGVRDKKGREITATAPPSGQRPHGSDGEVHRVEREGQLYMAKRIFGSVRQPETLRAAEIECLVLELMSASFGAVHFPAIVDAYVLQDRVYIVQELCDLGDLHEYCCSNSEPVTSFVASSVNWQTAAALHYLHARNICHGDLKPDNIFLCTPKGCTIPDERRRGGEPPVHVKVGDMGRAFAVTWE